MKHVLIVAIYLVFISLKGYSQWTNGTNINNTNTGNVGIGTTTPPYKLSVVNSAQTNGMTTGVSATQTQVNSGEMGDGALQIGYNLTSISNNNQLVTRALVLGNTNNLTAGGAILNMRGIELINNTNSGTSTTDLDAIYIGNGTSTGNVINNRGVFVRNMQGTNQAAFAVTPLAGTNHTYALLGEMMIPVGNFGIYSSGPNDQNYLAGNTSIGSRNITSMFNVGTGAQFQVSSTGAITSTSGINSSGSYVQSGSLANSFTGTSSFSNPTNSALFTGGNVGIGTATPNSNAKLDVNGNIYCANTIYVGAADASTTSQINGYALAVNGAAIFNKIKVKMYNSWPDYVFEKAYKLMPLSKLKKFVETNKHLPEMPVADEIKKDGIDVADNQKLLLKKIEELTLYMFELNKKVEIISKENKRLRKKAKLNNR